MPKITHCNDWGQIYLGFALLIYFFDSSTEFINILMALFLGLLLGEVLLKILFKRQRPKTPDINYKYLIKIPGSFSFPSGHTTSSFAVLGIVWCTSSRFKLIIMIVAILVSFSRIYLRVHYPTDILGGIILGFICAKAAILFTIHYDEIRHIFIDIPLIKLIFPVCNGLLSLRTTCIHQ